MQDNRPARRLASRPARETGARRTSPRRALEKPGIVHQPTEDGVDEPVEGREEHDLPDQ
ncbi:MAG: hypothetical protein KBI47_14215 [Armatimonadetes bacterium]|nr:hypothetical protein [Armatimonadota bacterium]